MKTLLIILFATFTGISIMAQNMEHSALQKDTTAAVRKDTLVKDILTQEPMLLGYCNRQAFKDTSFSWWFNSVYDMYEVDSVTAQKMAGMLGNLNITVVMGTWCSDSRREVPRFFRILDSMKFPQEKVTIITVGRNLKGMGSETDSLDIESVPTFIFYKNGKEIGRIVESPKVSLEKDMLKILYKKI